MTNPVPRLAVAGSSVLPAALSPEAAASYTNLAPKTLANWRYRGVGPAYVRMGARVVYLRADLDAWMASQRVSTSGTVA